MKTSAHYKRVKRNRSLIQERKRLLEKPGAMATAVDEKLAKKYSVSRSTIWKIVWCHRVTTTPS